MLKAIVNTGRNQTSTLADQAQAVLNKRYKWSPFVMPVNRDQPFRKQEPIMANNSKNRQTLAKSDTSFDTVFSNW
jgi:hypothetical protein